MGQCTESNIKSYNTTKANGSYPVNGFGGCVYLGKGEFITSRNGLYKLILQTDGNLVLYDKLNNPYWSTNTNT